MTLFEQILAEATYGTRKIFYHVSPNSFSAFEKRNSYRKDDSTQGGVFLSPSPQMVMNYTYDYLYLDRSNRTLFYLYRCKLNSEIDIFNPSNRVDQKRFIEEVENDPEEFVRQFVPRSRRLQKPNLHGIVSAILTDDHWSDLENPVVVKIIQKLGYDGLESTEHEAANVLIFDPSNIDIIGGGPWKTIDAKTVKEDFRKIFGAQLNTRHNIRPVVSPTEWFKNIRVEDVLGVTTYDKNGNETGVFGYSHVFRDDGSLSPALLSVFTNELRDSKFYRAVFNGEEYSNASDVEQAMVDKYGVA